MPGRQKSKISDTKSKPSKAKTNAPIKKTSLLPSLYFFISTQVKGLKEERKRLEEDCDTLSALLDENILNLKNLEKQVRNQESTNARLDKTLRQAENDNNKLVSELKQRNDEAKRAENKLKSLKNTTAEMELTYNNLDQQASRNKQ
jgi:DNA repair exonuclease SbcCD ATPase subunit